jgi:hypothetical protein
MTEIAPVQILYPVFAMFVLVAAVLFRMRGLRFAAVRADPARAEFYRAFPDDSEPEPLRVVARHFSNLFEMPVLFYVGVLMIYVTHHVSVWQVAGAWLYVALRYAHTVVHLTSNSVIVRFSLYFASAFVLLAMWATLFVALVRGG